MLKPAFFDTSNPSNVSLVLGSLKSYPQSLTGARGIGRDNQTLSYSAAGTYWYLVAYSLRCWYSTASANSFASLEKSLACHTRTKLCTALVFLVGAGLGSSTPPLDWLK